MTKKQTVFEEMENWDTNTKRYFNKVMLEWQNAGWTRKVAFREAGAITLQYLKKKKKWK